MEPAGRVDNLRPSRKNKGEHVLILKSLRSKFGLRTFIGYGLHTKLVSYVPHNPNHLVWIIIIPSASLLIPSVIDPISKELSCTGPSKRSRDQKHARDSKYHGSKLQDS